MGVVCTCAVCQKTFVTRPSDLKKGNGKYCSRKCFQTQRRLAGRRKEKKPVNCWTTPDELQFIAYISKQKLYLVGYKQAMLKRTDWEGLDKEAICRVLGI